MTDNKANIQIPVDQTNPGQFFACCGLLELADRLWPGAEGWFDGDDFYIHTDGNFQDLIDAFSRARIESSLTERELRRLGTLLSAKKASLTKEASSEKAVLQAKWKIEFVRIGSPFNISIDWWHDERGDRLDPKTWAAKQLVMDILADVLTAFRRMSLSRESDLWQWMPNVGRRFNFDSDLGAMGSALDVGFSFDPLSTNRRTRIDVRCRPTIELLAFIGLQRCRPMAIGRHSLFTYTCWPTPIPVNVASAAGINACGLGGSKYQFQLLDRTDYFKSFLPAQLYQGDRDE